jgi:hypothetical protein
MTRSKDFRVYSAHLSISCRSHEDFPPNGIGDAARNLILKGVEVGGVTVEEFRPNLQAGRLTARTRAMVGR